MPARKELDLETFNGRFAKRMLELRIAAGLSQEEAAEKIGTKLYSIYDWENARTFPAIVKIPAIAETYGIPMEEIFKNL